MAAVVGSIPPAWLEARDQKCNVMFLRHDAVVDELLQGLAPVPEIEQKAWRWGERLASPEARSH
jgi:hypothetical protein